MSISDGPRRHLGLLLSVLTGLQIVASLGMQGYVIAKMGAGVGTDAWYAGSVLSQLISGLTIENLPVVLIPMLAACTPAQQRAHTWLLCGLGMAAFTAVALLLALAAPLVTRLLVPGFSVEAQALTVAVTRIHLLGLGGAACTAVLSAVYQVRGRFLGPPVVTLLAALAAWVFVALTLESGGVAAAAWGQVLAFTVPALLLLPGVGLPRVSHMRPHILADISRRLSPLMLTRAYFLISAPLDRLLVSFLPAGSLVLFELVSRVFLAIQRVLTQGVVVPLLPRLSRLAQAGEWPAFRVETRAQAAWIFALGIVAVVGLEVGALGLMAWLGESNGAVVGRLSSGDLRQIAWLAALMAGILPTQVVISVFSGAYYAQGDTKSASRIAAIVFTVGMTLKTLGFWIWGIEGLAVGVTAWSALHCAVLAAKLSQDMTRLTRGGALVAAA